MTEKEFQEEIVKRIEQMESEEQAIQFMKKKDYIQVAVLAVICIIGIIAGAFM